MEGDTGCPGGLGQTRGLGPWGYGARGRGPPGLWGGGGLEGVRTIGLGPRATMFVEYRSRATRFRGQGPRATNIKGWGPRATNTKGWGPGASRTVGRGTGGC